MVGNLRKLVSMVLLLAVVQGMESRIVRGDLVEYSYGHADIGVSYEGSTLAQNYHFGNDTAFGASQYDPADVYIRVADSLYAPSVAPGDPTYDFTGRTTADPDLWVLPQNNVAGVPFLGFATELLTIGQWTTPIAWALESVTFSPYGTGISDRAEFSLWQSGFSPNVLMDTVDGIQSAPDDSDTYVQGIGGHDHFNWGFTEQGVYQVTLSASGTHAVDGFQSSVATYRFVVGSDTPPIITQGVPEPASLVLVGVGLAGCLVGYTIRRRRRLLTTAAESAA